MAQILSGFAFALKNISEPSLLNNSMPDTKKRGDIYSKIDGKGLTGYYYLNAFSAILSGVLFTINGYLPMILCFVVMLFACFLSTRLIETEGIKVKDKTGIEVKKYFEDLKQSFQYIVKSKRLKCLMIYGGIMWGIMCLYANYETALLQELEILPTYIGIISAILGIVAGIGSKKQLQFHKKYRNHSYSYLGISYTIACAIGGICVLLHLPFALMMVILLSTYLVRNVELGLFVVLNKRYLSNFTNQTIYSKICSVNGVIQSLLRMLITVVGSMLVSKMSIASAMAVMGSFMIIIMILLLKYMKMRVGLKP